MSLVLLQNMALYGTLCVIWYFSHKCAEYNVSGDTGGNLHAFLNNAFASEFSFPHIQVIYPTAPYR